MAAGMCSDDDPVLRGLVFGYEPLGLKNSQRMRATLDSRRHGDSKSWLPKRCDGRRRVRLKEEPRDRMNGRVQNLPVSTSRAAARLGVRGNRVLQLQSIKNNLEGLKERRESVRGRKQQSEGQLRGC